MATAGQAYTVREADGFWELHYGACLVVGFPALWQLREWIEAHGITVAGPIG